ncbi:restriction endonuclease subunit S [Enterobacter hormaechei]|uniref:restriction endonuclease subunit S n=1 Tax=Enterobacter hormaechei TaxID=158836 RepID=UPI000C15C83A|nr:restriction endonuclease subunit S [Enterobacter hormaechei]PHZ53287.1 restriction endonuclease subunit S [Enterobacter hormaechei]
MMENQSKMHTDKPVHAGFKLTEVGVIPKDWAVEPLSMITEPKRPISYGIVQTGPSVVNGVPCIRVVDISNGKIQTDNLITTSEKISASYRRTVLQKDDILIPLRGKVGEIAIVDKYTQGANLTRGVALISPKSSYDSKYIKQYLSCKDSADRLLASMNGSALQEITIATLRNFSLALPSSLKEQIAIGNVLSNTDDLITEIEKLIVKKRAIKAATMQQLLTGHTRLPLFSKHPDGTLKNYKTSELGLIPEDWECDKLGSLAKIQRGASPRPIDSPIWFDRNSSVGWLRISDVSKTKKYLTNTTQSLSELGIAHSRFVPVDNLVMSICATVGKPIITKKDLCIHDGFVVFNGLSVDQDYMYYVLKNLEDKWGNQGQTGSQMNLNTDLINETLVLIPSKQEEQTAIATVLSDMDAELVTLEKKLAKVRDIKQGMMQQLLTGRIRLPLDQQL